MRENGLGEQWGNGGVEELWGILRGWGRRGGCDGEGGETPVCLGGSWGGCGGNGEGDGRETRKWGGERERALGIGEEVGEIHPHPDGHWGSQWEGAFDGVGKGDMFKDGG